MGVPGLFAYLVAKYPNLAVHKTHTNTPKVDHLLLDANGIVYNVVNNIMSTSPRLVNNNEDFEHKVISQFHKYIEDIVADMKPTTTLYIAMDGCAPMAKIKHQRMRRFKQVMDEKEINAIAEKFGVARGKRWNLSAITPGTIFMHKLTKMTMDWIKNSDLGIDVVFSSSYTPGEGEHKLLDFIRRGFTDQQYMVYGLDADLLFLMLASKAPHITLLRETSEIEGKHRDGFTLISIDYMRECLVKDIQAVTTMKEINHLRCIDDFVVLCSLCGNDFMPSIPNLTLKPWSSKVPSGLDTIFKTYGAVLSNFKDYLVRIDGKDVHFDQAFLVAFLEAVGNAENSYFTVMNITAPRPKVVRPTTYEEAVASRENLTLHTIDDPVKLGNPGVEWRTNYYVHYGISEHYGLENAIDDYLHAIMWVANYYLVGCTDWYWHYAPHHAPFASDIVKFLKGHPHVMNEKRRLVCGRDKWYNVIKPLHQLLMVLPLESSFLLPLAYRNIMMHPEVRAWFPSEVPIDLLYKKKHWQGIPMINLMPPEFVLDRTSTLQDSITEFDTIRNKNYEPFLHLHRRSSKSTG